MNITGLLTQLRKELDAQPAPRSYEVARALSVLDDFERQHPQAGAEGWLAELREAMVPVFEAADFGSREQSPPGYWDADIDRVKAMLAAAPDSSPGGEKP